MVLAGKLGKVGEPEVRVTFTTTIPLGLLVIGLPKVSKQLGSIARDQVDR